MKIEDMEQAKELVEEVHQIDKLLAEKRLTVRATGPGGKGVIVGDGVRTELYHAVRDCLNAHHQRVTAKLKELGVDT